jgi:S1/P1 Nuclease
MPRLLVFIFLGLLTQVQAYGPIGHEIVGGIADKLIANTPTAGKVNALTDGITLEKAAVIADEIKAWDKNGPEDPKAFPHYVNHPRIDSQLRDFWHANPPTHDQNSSTPSHHWFHYTDVPVFTATKYSAGKRGRNQWDIVHMISYCVGVLRGEVPDQNPRKITKPLAVILLAHFVGDIHQPLHVGAEYFDQAGQAVDPDKMKSALEDEGGNTLSLQLHHRTGEAMAHHNLKLHGFWDNESVMANLPSFPSDISKEERREKNDDAKNKLIAQFTAEQPRNWRLPANVPLNKYAEAWADEMLPIAREAHERLQFSSVHSQLDQDREVAAGVAQEKDTADHLAYGEWSAKVVREELHKAGWRLADLLTQALTSTTISAESAAPEPSPTQASPPEPSPTALPIDAGSGQNSYGEYPENYKEVVIAWMKTNTLDVSHIDWQGDPRPVEMPGTNGHRARGYLVIFNTLDHSKPKTRSVLIRDGTVIGNLGF